MFLINDAKVRYGYFVSGLPAESFSATFVVKATCALHPKGVAEFLPEDDQDHLNGDCFAKDDPTQGLAYSSDFAPLKLNADIILSGVCHIPEGNAVQACPVTFKVGSWSKTLAVLGNRIRKKGLIGYSQPEVSSFSKMDLTWANTYGGENYPANPLGKGRDKKTLPDGSKIIEMPNVEYPGQIVRSSTGGGTPAGFGPIAETWPERMSKAKKARYNGEWLKERWPWFPKDFDWTFFNAAPKDQQLEGYLQGDEPLSFENLHPDHPEYQTRLPGERIRCFVEVRKGNDLEFREVPLVLDTLFVDMEKEKLNLVWRGSTETLTFKMKELEGHFLVREPMDKPMFDTLDEYKQRYIDRKNEILAEGEIEPVLLEMPVLTPPEIPDTSWTKSFEQRFEDMEKDFAKNFDPMDDPGYANSPAATRPHHCHASHPSPSEHHPGSGRNFETERKCYSRR